MSTTLEDAQADMKAAWLRKRYPKKFKRAERKRADAEEPFPILLEKPRKTVLPKIPYSGPEHTAYFAAKTRCTNPSSPSYHNYGGRGIKFLFTSFREFFDHIGPRPEGVHISGRAIYSLERIDNYGHYELGNVKWATQKEQCNNRRTSESVLEQAADLLLLGGFVRK